MPATTRYLLVCTVCRRVNADCTNAETVQLALALRSRCAACDGALVVHAPHAANGGAR
jgi:hypothetical protein